MSYSANVLYNYNYSKISEKSLYLIIIIQTFTYFSRNFKLQILTFIT